MNYEQLKEFEYWNFERVQKYLLDQGKISDSNWLENSLYPQIKRAAVHLTRATKWATFPRSQTHALYRATFVMDENLNLKLI
mmetsp:Transcript_10161/g.8705  ORF Transcript_10161/g.8705 Transcript_10161/m.8705 type:complete len:82 (+) Transcript_10161:1128-1373(+)